MITGAEVIACARSWVGTPYRHQGYLKHVGCDCIGLIGGVAAEIGVSDAWLTEHSAQFKGYGPQPDAALLFEGCARFLDRVRGGRDQAQLGDVLVMRFKDQPMHFGFLSAIDPAYVIHALALYPRKVVEHRIDDLWESRIVRCYRLRGLG